MAVIMRIHENIRLYMNSIDHSMKTGYWTVVIILIYDRHRNSMYCAD